MKISDAHSHSFRGGSVKRLLLIALVALSGCSQPPTAGCYPPMWALSQMCGPVPLVPDDWAAR